AADQCHVRNTVPLLRNERQRGRDLPGGGYAHLFGSVLDVIAIELENGLGVLHVEKHRSAIDVLDRTQLELERGQDTKVAASALRPGGLGGGVDPNASHPRKVDDDATVISAEPRHAVTAAANREIEAALPREVHRRDYVTRVGRTHYDRRAFIDHRVLDPAR